MIERSAALSAGLKYYDDTCARHGACKRYVRNYTCVQCRKKASERRRRKLGMKPKPAAIPKTREQYNAFRRERARTRGAAKFGSPEHRKKIADAIKHKRGRIAATWTWVIEDNLEDT